MDANNLVLDVEELVARQGKRRALTLELEDNETIVVT